MFFQTGPENFYRVLDSDIIVTFKMMRIPGGLLEREVTRNDPEWTAAIAFLTVSEKVRIKPSRRQYEENKTDCRTVVQQLVSSIPRSVLMRTLHKMKKNNR